MLEVKRDIKGRVNNVCKGTAREVGGKSGRRDGTGKLGLTVSPGTGSSNVGTGQYFLATRRP